MPEKLCTKCNLEKDINSFHKTKLTKDGRHPHCKECKNEYGKLWRNEYPDYSQQYSEQWHKQHPLYNKQYKEKHVDRDRASNEQWKKNNPNYGRQYYQEHKPQANQRTKDRLRVDPNFKAATRLRIRMHKAINGNFKVGSAVRDLGCTMPELRTHIESLWQPGMTWENWSRTGWHIDHIIPLASFDLTDREQFLKACHYTNLQPLWAKDNLAKRKPRYKSDKSMKVTEESTTVEEV